MSRSCSQGISGGTVVRMFNRLPAYSEFNRLVLQKNISRDSATRNEQITIFYFFISNVLTRKLVVVAFASIIFLSNIAQCDGCDPQHSSVTARKPFVACGVKISPVIGYNTNIPDIFQVFTLL